MTTGELSRRNFLTLMASSAAGTLFPNRSDANEIPQNLHLLKHSSIIAFPKVCESDFNRYLEEGWRSGLLGLTPEWHKLYHDLTMDLKKRKILLGQFRILNVSQRSVIFKSYWASQREMQSFFTSLRFDKVEKEILAQGLRFHRKDQWVDRGLFLKEMTFARNTATQFFINS